MAQAPKLVFQVPRAQTLVGVPTLQAPVWQAQTKTPVYPSQTMPVAQMPVAQTVMPMPIQAGTTCKNCSGAMQVGWVACPACGMQV